MKATYAFALPKILIHEGGKVNHPKDPGGRTNQGVTQRVYDGFRDNEKLKRRSVYEMENWERDKIYKKQYWDAIRGDVLPQGVDYVVFDGAVHSGPSQSVKWLQRALYPLYTGVIDGRIGEATISAVNAVNDHDKLIAEILKRREAFLRALKTWATFGKGWMNRINQVRKIGQAWAIGSEGPAPVFFEGGNQKALLADAKAKSTKGVADATTGGGIAGLGITGALEQAKATLQPLAGDSNVISYVVTGLVIASVLSVAGGVLYRIRAKRKDAEIDDALDLGVIA